MAFTYRISSHGISVNGVKNDNSNPQQGGEASRIYSDSNFSPDDQTSGYTQRQQRFRIVPPTTKDARKLFVGGLPSDITNEEFGTYFAQFGTVVDSVVMFDRNTGRSRGFGFVTFEDKSICQKLLNIGMKADEPNVTQLEMRGKVIEVKAAEPKPGNWDAKRSHHQDVPGRNGTFKNSAAPNPLNSNLPGYPLVYPGYFDNPDVRHFELPNYPVHAQYYPFSEVPFFYNYGSSLGYAMPQYMLPVYPDTVASDHRNLYYSGLAPGLGSPFVVPPPVAVSPLPPNSVPNDVPSPTRDTTVSRKSDDNHKISN